MGILDRLFSKKNTTLPSRVTEPSLKAKSQLMTVKASTEREAQEIQVQAEAIEAVEETLLKSGKIIPARVKDVVAGIKSNCAPFKPVNILAVSKGRTFHGTHGEELTLAACVGPTSHVAELESYMADVCAHEYHRVRNRYELERLGKTGINKVEILTIPGVSCQAACRLTKAVPIDEAPPLPLKNCSVELGYCRCHYRAVIPDF